MHGRRQAEDDSRGGAAGCGHGCNASGDDARGNTGGDVAPEGAHDAGRRAFLRDGLLAVAAITVVAGEAAPLHAMARSYVAGLSAGATVRYPIPAADGATIDKANRLILVRYQGMVHAFNLECPHKGTMVQWQTAQQRFYCPKHKSTFRAEGTRIQGKSPRSLDRYAVRVEGGNVVVDTTVVFDAAKDAAAWAAAGAMVA